MEKSQPSVNFNFAPRAAKLRTKLQQAALSEKQQTQIGLSMGKTKEQYWKENVRTREDVVQYYTIYHPDYPPELAAAIADRLEKLIWKYNDESTRGHLTADEQKMITYFGKHVHQSHHWDPLSDIENQKLEGKISLTNQRLDKLLADC